MPDYSRQKRLPGVGEAGQEKLARARVLVIGAGGLGSPVLAYLAGAGVGLLGISDDDRIDASNLHRQTLFTAADTGRLKAEVAAERIAAVNPSVRTELFGRIAPDEAVALFRRFDLVVECSDDMSSRFLCSDAATMSGTALILASVHQYEGQLQVIDPRAGGPCLRCLWPAEPAPDAAASCAESGVLGPVPGILGTMQANEALKRLLGLPGQAPDRLLLVDLLDNRTDQLRIDAENGCASRGGCVAMAERAMAARGGDSLERRFSTLGAARAAGYRLVDVRQEDERAAWPMPEAVHVPLPVLLESGAALPAEGPLLLVCASGRRSARGAQHMRDSGRADVFTLPGGLQGLSE
ncbi:HesA/MoeB/ThiF family protein [Acetobacteraceae bacterium KSS8]|uniref:HesA/MoeB/ThiF family protein n=1 Tax=Endosaccharibacter trunci TaxID=2812733 RepID=A0ABT1WAX5_9PROT|nr:HesA/MoeB/ThiF family protein [Acetobacteraceae bacterium KSS8]